MELVGLKAISETYGVSRQLAHYWSTRPDFPKPAHYMGAGKSGGRLWSAARVKTWCEKHGHEARNGDGDGN